MNALLGGTAESPISSLLLMLETPDLMVVVCTAGGTFFIDNTDTV